MTRYSRYVWCAVSLLILIHARNAAAQTSNTGGRFEVEVFGGAVSGGLSTAGQAGAFPALGETLTADFRPIGPVATYRRVPSWYFGDGSAQFNENRAALGIGTRITPLDAVLGQQAATRDAGGAVGIRARYRITSRLSAEFSWESARAPIRFSQDFLDGLELSRASFQSAFVDLFDDPFLGQVPTVVVSSDADLRNGTRKTSLLSGTVVVDLARVSVVTPYVTVGAGMFSGSGDLPSAQVSGDYLYVSGFIPAPIHETDTVVLDVSSKDSAAVVFGGGVRTDISRRWGVRADVRATFSGNEVNLRMNTHWTSVFESQLGFLGGTYRLAPPPAPVLAFSNTSLSEPSTLSAPDIKDLDVFAGSGTNVRVSVTGGLFFRF